VSFRTGGATLLLVLWGAVGGADVPESSVKTLTGSGGQPAYSQQDEDRRPEAMKDIGYEQKLGAQLPLDLPLRDEAGQKVTLGQYFHGRPVVLSLVYYECPMLCTLSQNGLVSALGVLSMNPGKDFEIVTVSFDPRDTPERAAQRKKVYLDRYRRAGAEGGWHFLTGEAPALAKLTRAVGFRYTWDEETKQFAHGTGIVVVTPGGVVSRYLYGIEYAPKDLRLALVESGEGKLGNPVDAFLLGCYRYDPAHGRYGAFVLGLIRLGAVITLLVVGGFVGVMLRRERKGRA
jgi:protein SCO1/2